RRVTSSSGAMSQPSLWFDWTGTAGQSLFCTTRVGASMKVPAGEYSMRTSDGVRNSKRAFPARMVGWLCRLAPHATSAGRRPINGQLAALARLRVGGVPLDTYACDFSLAIVSLRGQNLSTHGLSSISQVQALRGCRRTSR